MIAIIAPGINSRAVVRPLIYFQAHNASLLFYLLIYSILKIYYSTIMDYDILSILGNTLSSFYLSFGVVNILLYV